MQISRIFSALLTALSSSLIVTIAAVYYSINTLPSIDELMDMDYQVPLKVYTSDHKLIGVFGEKFRQPVYLNKIPKLLQNAYIAVEDQRFYDHFGVDPVGLTRAIVNFVLTGKKSQGASTITMQVARNFFLSKEKTWVRKINEILLALKIEYNLPKSKILELYLNKIYLGNRSYGVAAASEIYYAKDLDELTIAEIAMLAGLPKAPSSINPVKNPKRAMERRNFVLKRMYDEGFINLFQYSYAVSEPIRAKYHGIELEADAPHVSNLVHQLLRKQYGDDIYTKGFSVITTIDSEIQETVKSVISDHIKDYVQNKGLDVDVNIGDMRRYSADRWFEKMKLPKPKLGKLAVVMMVYSNHAVLKTDSDNWVTVDLNDINSPNIGDIFTLEQSIWEHIKYPHPEAAFTLVESKTGGIIALLGSNDNNQFFNRATQATRQVGSTFKSLLYAIALTNGMTLASVVNDSPFVAYGGDTELLWRPSNHDSSYTGPMRLRDAMIRSRNLVSIRLMDMLGVKEVTGMIDKFGLNTQNMPQNLSLALGSGTATPLEMASAYTVFGNEGNRSKPFIVKQIFDQKGSEISIDSLLQSDGVYLTQQPPVPVLSKETAYLMFDLLGDVVKRGTGRKAKKLNRIDVGGKTGTTNGLRDIWFCGITKDYSATIWLGFDDYSSLGVYASQFALPIWIDIMSHWLADKPESLPDKPNDIVSLKIPKDVQNQNSKYIFELFDQKNEEALPNNQNRKSNTDAQRSNIF